MRLLGLGRGFGRLVEIAAHRPGKGVFETCRCRPTGREASFRTATLLAEPRRDSGLRGEPSRWIHPEKRCDVSVVSQPIQPRTA